VGCVSLLLHDVQSSKPYCFSLYFRLLRHEWIEFATTPKPVHNGVVRNIQPTPGITTVIAPVGQVV
jgi:hypothetical protein